MATRKLSSEIDETHETSRHRRSTSRLINYKYKHTIESESDSSEPEEIVNSPEVISTRQRRKPKRANYTSKPIIETESDLSSPDEKDKPSEVISTRLRRKQKCSSYITNPIIETESDSSTPEEKEKPSEVLFEEEDVAGKEMFGFKRNQRKGGIANLLSKVATTPQTASIKSKEPIIMPPKTPHVVRNKIKKEIVKIVSEDSSDGDFSDSGSEYNQEGSSSSEVNSIEEHSTEEDAVSENNVQLDKKKMAKSLNNKKCDMPNDNYVVEPDNYFSWQANSKIITSNHTLQKLKQPKLFEDQLQELLSSCTLAQTSLHDKPIRNLFQTNCNNFNKWAYLLHEGFSILLYGLGSKRNLLQAFQKEMVQKNPVIVVNGYFPSLTIKDVLDGILVDILDATSVSNVYEAVEMIKYKLDRLANIKLFIIVHNIDGPMLRNNKSQNVLAALADIRNINLIASVDHINTPLIWDHSKLSKFNFTWWDVTSFLPYTDETSFESSMLVQRSGALALSSLTNVYQSLTKNSKGVFKLIVEYQLENKSQKHYAGMPFKVLYSQCRENFLVSSDLALRAQLTEFLDHKLVKTKRSVDGTELLLIPINNTLLHQFLEQIS